MHRKSRVEQVSEMINRNSDMVYRLAFSMVKSVQDAEDVHQEVFIRYIRTNPLFESREHERAWFIRVTTNLCKNLWKSAWRQKMVSMDSLEETQEGNAYVQQSLNEEEELLVETVKRLPFKYRVVVHLFYYEEMSLEEIAKALNLKSSNVRTRLTRARKMLREWLKEDV
ncbi:MAG: RNA polymerase sigma factor [Lachnospiraceae bacterium]|nr:RNA polymerase sigma factor [Lachnospiraceae bacterium]